jgi:hypothetical protein
VLWSEIVQGLAELVLLDGGGGTVRAGDRIGELRTGATYEPFLHTKGCSEALYEKIYNNLDIAIGICVVVGALQVCIHIYHLFGNYGTVPILFQTLHTLCHNFCGYHYYFNLSMNEF